MIADEQIYPALAEVFSDVFLRDDIPLSGELTAKDVDGWDSFRQIEIVMACEAAFNLKFTSSELDHLRNVGDLVKIIAARGTLPA